MKHLTFLKQLKKTNQSVGIVGFGVENRQFLKWLIESFGFPAQHIYLFDLKEIDHELINKYKIPQANITAGSGYLEHIKNTNCSLLIKAPGMWSLLPEFIEFRITNGPESVISSLTYFFEKYREQIIAITGTKGKSTTSSITNHILNSIEGYRSHYCGNTTNISPYQFWINLDDSIDPSVFFVVETSSFQLQDLGMTKLSPKYSAITNYFVDHLDQHANKEEYWDSKDQIFVHQKKKEHVFITQTVLQNSPNAALLKKNGIIVDSKIVSNLKQIFSFPLHGQHNDFNTSLSLLLIGEVINNTNSAANIDDLAILKENQENIQSSLNTYQPLPHRLELVHHTTRNLEFKDDEIYLDLTLSIQFFNDSAATEPDAVIAAIQSLTQLPHQYIWLQVSGVSKGSDLTKLAHTILEKQVEHQLYRVDYCGDVGSKILSTIYSELGLTLEIPRNQLIETVEESFESIDSISEGFSNWLSNMMHELDVVGNEEKIVSIMKQKVLELNIVLSPCGSSFDEFDNYHERGIWWQTKARETGK
jgi:UDP-N-acetylmuramoyl-L-alanine---L-glutamate ligase